MWQYLWLFTDMGDVMLMLRDVLLMQHISVQVED